MTYLRIKVVQIHRFRIVCSKTHSRNRIHWIDSLTEKNRFVGESNTPTWKGIFSYIPQIRSDRHHGPTLVSHHTRYYRQNMIYFFTFYEHLYENELHYEPESSTRLPESNRWWILWLVSPIPAWKLRPPSTNMNTRQTNNKHLYTYIFIYLHFYYLLIYSMNT